MKAKLQEMVEGMRSMEVERNPDYPLDDIGIAKLLHALCKGIACYVQKRSHGTYLMGGVGAKITVVFP